MRASSHFTASTSRRHGPALPIAWQHGRTSGTSPQPPAPPRVPHTEYRTPGPRRPGQHGPGQRESPPGRNLRGFQLVREGGVEPPRPFGHWNLNPARLPIPPPAHWVCRPSPTEWCERLPTCRRLARCQGWIHIPFPRPSRPAPPVPATGNRRPGALAPPGPRPPRLPIRHRPRPSLPPRHPSHVSDRTGSRINLVPVLRISPGAGRAAQSGAGHWSWGASTIHGRSCAGKSSKRGLPGNFGRGLRKASTTRRPGRQGEPADFPTRGYDQ